MFQDPANYGGGGTIASAIGLDKLFQVFTNRPQIGQISAAVDVPPVPDEPVPGQTGASATPNQMQQHVQWIENAVAGTWGYFVGVGKAAVAAPGKVLDYIQGGGPGKAVGNNASGIVDAVAKPVWVTVLVVAVAAGIILLAAGKSGIFKVRANVRA